MTKNRAYTADSEQLARYAKALGHPARITIIEFLASQSSCFFGDIHDELPIAKATVSQHLKELKDAGLIQGEIEPPKVRYCINDKNWGVAKQLMGDFFAHRSKDSSNERKSKAMKVLILCTGNSCRSQMAHGFLQSFDKNLTVCSAGTQAAGRLNEGAVRAMAAVGIDISHHTSEGVERYLEEEWDSVITVCGGANETCPTFTGKVKQRLHIGFDDPSHATGTAEFIESEFRRVRDEIKNRFYEWYVNEVQRRATLPDETCCESNS